MNWTHWGKYSFLAVSTHYLNGRSGVLVLIVSRTLGSHIMLCSIVVYCFDVLIIWSSDVWVSGTLFFRTRLFCFEFCTRFSGLLLLLQMVVFWPFCPYFFRFSCPIVLNRSLNEFLVFEVLTSSFSVFGFIKFLSQSSDPMALSVPWPSAF